MACDYTGLTASAQAVQEGAAERQLGGPGEHEHPRVIR